LAGIKGLLGHLVAAGGFVESWQNRLPFADLPQIARPIITRGFGLLPLGGVLH
jgi:hypothetical protein